MTAAEHQELVDDAVLEAATKIGMHLYQDGEDWICKGPHTRSLLTLEPETVGYGSNPLEAILEFMNKRG